MRRGAAEYFWAVGRRLKTLEARVGIEPTHKGFADRSAARLNPFDLGTNSHLPNILSAFCPPQARFVREDCLLKSDALGIAPRIDSQKAGVISAVPTSSPSDQPVGRSVIRSPQQLRLHPALERLGWTGGIAEFNEAARPNHPSVTDPILVSTNGTILSGFGRWRSAVFGGRLEINCIEYLLNEDESLQFILTHHQTRSGWNDFVRICLALTLETTLQQNALDNMRAGGKLKGLANLPEADRIDVRKEIARSAGVGDRNVSNVRTILQRAHPILVGALKEGALSINRAHQLCKLPKTEQLEQFVSFSEERATNRVIRRSIPQPKEKRASVDVLAVLDVLQRQEARLPGSVAVRVGRHKRTLVLIGEDLSAGLPAQPELRLQ